MPFTALANPGEEGEGKTPESFSLPVIETGFEESELVESELELEAWMTAPFESTFAEIEDRIEVEEWMSSPF